MGHPVDGCVGFANLVCRQFLGGRPLALVFLIVRLSLVLQEVPGHLQVIHLVLEGVTEAHCSEKEQITKQLKFIMYSIKLTPGQGLF